MTRYNPPKMNDELLTYEEVGAVLRLKKRTIERLVHDGHLVAVPPTPNSSLRRIKRTELESYMEHLGAA